MVVDMISSSVGSKQPGTLVRIVYAVSVGLIDRRGITLSSNSVTTAVLQATRTARDFQPPRWNTVCRLDFDARSLGDAVEATRPNDGRDGVEYALDGWSYSHEAIRGRARRQSHGRGSSSVRSFGRMWGLS